MAELLSDALAPAGSLSHVDDESLSHLSSESVSLGLHELELIGLVPFGIRRRRGIWGLFRSIFAGAGEL